jgi:glutathione S-transferase
MADYKLRCFAQSGNAYKVALMLELAGADWEPVFVDFFNGGVRAPEYVALNEMGEVPVLEHDGLVLSQSGVILDYLTERYREFAPRSEAERREVLRWTLWDNHKLTSYIASLRFLMQFVPEEKADKRVIAWLSARAGNALKVLDRHLANQEWVAADHMSTADFSCIGYLYYDGEFGHDLTSFANIERWRRQIAALPGWKHPYDLMPGHPIPAGAPS